MAKMKRVDNLLANLVGGIIVFLDDLNSGKSDHSEKRKKNGDYFRKSLSEALFYLEKNFPGSRKRGSNARP